MWFVYRDDWRTGQPPEYDPPGWPPNLISIGGQGQQIGLG
jgi:hypothetical protein